MRRPLTIAAVLLAALMAYGLYNMKYEVKGLEGRLTGLNRQLLEQDEAIQVLRAEWSYLNRPARLQRLAQRHLELAPVSVHGIEALATVPLKVSSRPVANLKTLLPGSKPVRPGTSKRKQSR
ncbi:MAG TPA: hypothetical protein QGF63_18190 [Alphaproteobacteria bacterium]|jgi:hypothetical protein|nr:hypothetical protein [Alphaproteobacteria bacterium]MDP6270554.1 hypothetical protein [Alphaproteobacteria bacterium]MDP7164737.1 hypothetical protein [Alphaproteobacteria bacterium]MDP7428297.1 hypothetical protein [Alphaproteobacteria bacterium]HJM51757.1 hypothetical protein [Alphaproteobacteria bacterium]|tara:strand:- start:109 stop:474 length:366 start_codon:yes stop_codon:yes gene_type:complete